MFLLIFQPIKHLNSVDRSYISTESIAFWYMISKKCHNHSVITHIWGLWRCKTVKICKIHWKLIIFKSQYCFANISTTKAPIFMKFEIYIHKIVKNHQKSFRKDLWKHQRTWGVNVRARISSRQNRRAHVYASCARVSARIFTQKSFDNSLLSYEYKSQIS